MKKNQLKSAVVNVVELSTSRVEFIDNAIGYEIQVIEMDNLYNKDRASLTKLLVENIALAMTTEPSYKEWNYIHELFRSGICKATGMEYASFDKNIWDNITKRLEADFELVKPKSPVVKSAQKVEQLAKIEAMSIDELKQAGKLVEIAKRQEKALKASEKLVKQDAKDFVKDFKTSMETLAKNEYGLAMYINSNLNKIRNDFIASQS